MELLGRGSSQVPGFQESTGKAWTQLVNWTLRDDCDDKRLGILNAPSSFRMEKVSDSDG